MLKNSPDVKKGDLSSGLYLPNEGMIMFVNKVKIAVNTDGAFAKAFFQFGCINRQQRPNL
tara:strand:- start:55 stop:234 length:180 start_codon:yes stop_codon:yes gene_type:complete